MLVSRQMARETNITNRATGLTLKQHRGTLHKKARKWMEKSSSLYQAERRVWGEHEHKCSIISTAFRQRVREHFLPWKHANFSADLVKGFLWVTFNRCLRASMKLVFITAACARRKALPQLTPCSKELSGNTTGCPWCSYTSTQIQTAPSHRQNCDWHWRLVLWSSATDRSVKWKRVARKAVFTSVLWS